MKTSETLSMGDTVFNMHYIIQLHLTLINKDLINKGQPWPSSSAPGWAQTEDFRIGSCSCVVLGCTCMINVLLNSI